MIIANLAYFTWRQGWISNFLPSVQVVIEEPAQPAFIQARNRLSLLSETPGAFNNTGEEELTNTPLNSIVAEVASDFDQYQGDNSQQDQRQPWCGLLRGFVEESLARQFMDGLSPGLGTATLSAYEEAVSSTWWVHMPAFESEAVALTMLRELQDKNIDSYYMRTGDLRGGISLGVFSREESARTAQAQIARLGYPTSIAEVFRMEERFAVALALLDETSLESPEWLDLLSVSEGLELAENSCEMIAPTSQFP